MTDLFAPPVVAGTFAAIHVASPDYKFVTQACDELVVDLAGIPGDLHAGLSRRSGVREPWFPRGTVMRNDRQLSGLCERELAHVARQLDLPVLRPEWIGGNLSVSGLADFSALAPGTRLAFGGQWGGKGRFDGGAVLRVEAYNSPCRLAGRAVAAMTGRPELEFGFVKAAAALRGLMLSVEVPGRIATGDRVVVLPPILPKRARV